MFFSVPIRSRLRLLPSLCGSSGEICVSMLIYSTRSFLLCLSVTPLLAGWLVGCRLSPLHPGTRLLYVVLNKIWYSVGEPVSTTAHPLGTTLTIRSIGSSSVLHPKPILGCGSCFFATTTTFRAIVLPTTLRPGWLYFLVTTPSLATHSPPAHPSTLLTFVPPAYHHRVANVISLRTTHLPIYRPTPASKSQIPTYTRRTITPTVIPRNYLLFACHATNATAQLIQCGRWAQYWKFGGREQAKGIAAKVSRRGLYFGFGFG